MKTNQDYTNAALDRLRGNWAPAIVASLIFILVAMLCSGNRFLQAALHVSPGAAFALAGATSLLTFFVLVPLQVGYYNAIRQMYERRDYDVTGNMIRLSLSNYLHKVGGMFLMTVKVMLWMCLFIIPGFIMALAYAMTPYILEEHPEIGIWEASTRSREMMRGHKFDLFYLELSFIGWVLLGALTCGIGMLWVSPYMSAALAAFYNDLKAEQGEAAVIG